MSLPRSGHTSPLTCGVKLAEAHLSELVDEPVETPDQLVDEGELITVKVAEVDLQRHRVRLGVAGGADRT